MAQSRERRNQRRRNQQTRRPVPPSRPQVDPRRRNLRRIVIAFLITVGLAGVLAINPSGDGSGSPPASTSGGSPVG